MTPATDADGLEPGPASDRRVAVEVLGWAFENSAYWPPKGQDGYGHWYWPDQEPHLPAFSADIAAAWRVVEHLRAAGWHLAVATHEAGGLWVCNVWRVDHGPIQQFYTEAKTPALAIVRAALQAVAVPRDRGQPEAVD